MPLNEKNVNAYNIRRAEAFAAAGVNDLDLRWAHPTFEGKGHGDCTLCGKKDILWLFALHFDKPDLVQSIGAIEKQITRTEAVTFNPVGSECIQTWFEALPESLEKLEFLKRWKIELQRMARAKAAQATLNYLTKRGFASIEDALDRGKAIEEKVKATGPGYYTKVCGLTYYDRCALTKLRARLKRQGRLSHNAVKFLADLILRAEQALADDAKTQPAAPAVPPPPAAPAILADPLVVRANKVLNDPTFSAALDNYRRGVVKDIVEKVTKFGSFRSTSQKGYLESLVSKAEQTVEVAQATLPTEGPIACGVGPKHGDENFASASGIVGARY